MNPRAATATDRRLQVFDSERLVALMKKNDMSTTELGARCDRSAFSVKFYMEGRADPTAAVIGGMAYALNVRVEDLFRDATADDVEMVALVAPRKRKKT
jgi:transcriptional regulator with XRE-family HTH domain